jgi:hypothetical protein
MNAVVALPQVRDEVPASAATGVLTEALLHRIRGEFREMPGLTLTLRQAARLWTLDPLVCDVALRILVEERYLERTSRGAFRRAD